MSKFEDLIESLLVEADPQQVAKTILQQLGGNRMIAMTGAKNLASGTDKEGRPYLMFKIGSGAKSGINHIKIALNGRDLYDIDFGKIRGYDFKVLKSFDNIYADQLKDIIEQETGMYLSL